MSLLTTQGFDAPRCALRSQNASHPPRSIAHGFVAHSAPRRILDDETAPVAKPAGDPLQISSSGIDNTGIDIDRSGIQISICPRTGRPPLPAVTRPEAQAPRSSGAWRLSPRGPSARGLPHRCMTDAWSKGSRPHVTGLGLDVRASSTGRRPRTRRSTTTGGDHHRAQHEATGRTSASRRTEAGAHRRRPELLRASRALVGRHRFEDPTFHIRPRVDVSGAHPLPARHLSGRRAYGRRTLGSAAILSTSVPPTALARRPGEELAATS